MLLEQLRARLNPYDHCTSWEAGWAGMGQVPGSIWGWARGLPTRGLPRPNTRLPDAPVLLGFLAGAGACTESSLTRH